jgi:hypothetical protein
MSNKSIDKVVSSKYRSKVALINSHIEKFKQCAFVIANNTIFPVVTELTHDITPGYDPYNHYDEINGRLLILKKILSYFDKYEVSLSYPLEQTVEKGLDNMLDVKLHYENCDSITKLDTYLSNLPRKYSEKTGTNTSNLDFYKTLIHTKESLKILNIEIEKVASQYDGSAYQNSAYRHWYNFSWFFNGWFDSDYEYTNVAGYYRLFKNNTVCPLLTNVTNLINMYHGCVNDVQSAKKDHTYLNRIIISNLNDCLRIKIHDNDKDPIHDICIGNVSRFKMSHIQELLESEISKKLPHSSSSSFDVIVVYCFHSTFTKDCQSCKCKKNYNINHNCFLFLYDYKFEIITDNSTMRGLFRFEYGNNYVADYNESMGQFYLYSPVEIDFADYKKNRIESKMKKLRQTLNKVHDTFNNPK